MPIDPTQPILFAGATLIFNCSDDPFCSSTPPGPPDVPVTTPVDVPHKTPLLRAFLIAAAALLVLSFLLFLLFYSLLRRRRQLRLRHASPPAAGPTADPSEEVTHHVWLIRTVGLDDSAIGSIAAFAYKPTPGKDNCTVCLGEFKDGEMVKLLPRCTHAFHASCVDTWLRSHDSCPLCRAPVLAEADPEKIVLEENGESSSSSSSTSVVPVRRSVSMDAASLAALLEKAELELSNVNLGKETRGSGKCVVMKRSQSTRSGRFFLGRSRRGRSSSVLPL